MHRHFNLLITGHVQGVFYRASAANEGSRLGLMGFVRNEDDGSVYAEAEGEPDALDRFVAWCKRGPSRARVDKVKIVEGDVVGHKPFHVR